MIMTRMAICPVCEKVFEVCLKNQACCREHQKEWRRFYERRRKLLMRIKTDDLEWANRHLETVLASCRNLAGKTEQLDRILIDLEKKLALAEKSALAGGGTSDLEARLEKAESRADDLENSLERATQKIAELTDERDAAQNLVEAMKRKVSGKSLNMRECKRMRLRALDLPCGERKACFKPGPCSNLPAGATLEQAERIESEISGALGRPVPPTPDQTPARETAYQPRHRIGA